MNLGQMLENVAGAHGNRTAIVFNDYRQSYAELDTESNKVANSLIGLGITKGDRIALLLPNNLEHTALLFGIFKAGASAVPLDTKYKGSELQSILNDSEPKLFISCQQYLDPTYALLQGCKYIKHVVDTDGKTQGAISYRQLSEGSKAKPDVKVGDEDVAVIGYTSGPSSSPRGSMLTHHNMLAEAEISALGFQQTEKDVAILFALPLHHVFGLIGVLLTGLLKGSAVIIVPGLSLAGVMGTIEKERATIFMGVPYIYRLMIEIMEKDGLNSDLSSIRLFGSCGAPLPKKTIREFKKIVDKRLIDFYGLTESTMHITCPPINGSGKFGSVGKALPGWEMKIVDDNGVEQPVNRDGEIIVKGTPVMRGYYKNAKDTAEVLKGGWLYTGDIGRIDKDGYLFITGRKKEMIIRKGQNVYPVDVEELLSRHHDVREAVVVGIMDKVRGETLRAVISLKDGSILNEQEVKQYCLKNLASYKVPKQIFFTKAFPRNATGEILKEDLKMPISKLKKVI